MEQLHVGQHQYRFDENEIGRWTNVLNGRVIIARKPLVQWQCFEEAYKSLLTGGHEYYVGWIWKRSKLSVLF